MVAGTFGAGAAGFTLHQNSFLFGLASDGDTLNERFAGISGRYENKHLGNDKIGLRFQFESASSSKASRVARLGGYRFKRRLFATERDARCASRAQCLL